MPTKPKRPRDPATVRAESAIKLALSHVLWAELERLDLTVYALAKRSGLPDDTVREYTAGASEPSLSRLMALERGLNRPSGWLTAAIAERMAG